MLFLSVLGTAWRIEVVGHEASAIEAEIARTWDRCLLEPTDAPDAPLVRVAVTGDGSASDDQRIIDVHAADAATLLSLLTTNLTLRGIEANAGQALMFHSAASADPISGRTVALVGPSGAGKTTASIALSRRGSYVTDETLLVREDMAVVPYPKPLSIGDHSEDTPKAQAAPDELGLGLLSSDRPTLVALLLLDRRPQETVGEPIITDVGLIEAVLALAPETSYLAKVPHPLQRLRALIESCGGVRRVTYQEASTLAETLAPLWADTPDCPDVTVASEADSGSTPDIDIDLAIGTDGLTAVRRLPVLDAIADGGELCLMVGSDLRKLAGIGPFLWSSARGAIGVRELAVKTAEEFGYIDNWEREVASAINDLVGAGVLEYV